MGIGVWQLPNVLDDWSFVYLLAANEFITFSILEKKLFNKQINSWILSSW
jgi:hypothetical protein